MLGTQANRAIFESARALRHLAQNVLCGPVEWDPLHTWNAPSLISLVKLPRLPIFDDHHDEWGTNEGLACRRRALTKETDGHNSTTMGRRREVAVVSIEIGCLLPGGRGARQRASGHDHYTKGQAVS